MDKKSDNVINNKQKILGFELEPAEDVYINYLLPSLVSCFFYILHFSADLVLTYRHFHDDNPVWASLTLFFMYLPVLGSFIITISSTELWPEYEGCGYNNFKWAVIKTSQHVFFPVWSMWRSAEKIFWSIEGIRSKDEGSRNEALETVNAARTIELYYFFQGYLQAIPQILLQLHILLRDGSDTIIMQTVDVQILSLIMNLSKMAITTTLYQRFKSQKYAGRQYPWFKLYKQVDYPDSRRFGILITSKLQEEDTKELHSFENEPTSLRLLERRRSSDLYLEPTLLYPEDKGKSSQNIIRETSVVDGPERNVYTDDEVDLYNIPRLIDIKGLLEDDLAGKIVAFLWWFCFLLARMLAISAFAYFYPTHILWLLSSHFILVVALLLYDVKADEVRRAKAIFFIFIGLIYLFCLIEFKIKFKKTKFIYYGFFTLVFSENIIMCFIWWFANMETIDNDWWYKYMFYLIIISILLSLISMLLYLKINKPEKIVVDRVRI